MVIEKRDRISAYLSRCDGATSGAGGHDATFRVACAVVKGFDCSPDEAVGYLRDWNSKCSPPWTDDELLHKAQTASEAPDMLGAPGYLLKKKTEYTGTGNSRDKKTYEPKPHVVPPIDLEKIKNLRIAKAGEEKLTSLPDWTLEEIKAASPQELPATPDDMFEAFAKTLWEKDDVIWVGGVRDSGHPGKSGHFVTVDKVVMRGLPGGEQAFSSGCTYNPGSYRRNKDSIKEHRYAIVESDSMSYERQGAVLKYLIDLGLPIKMIVDTRGASYHGWLDITGLSEEYVNRLGILLCGIHAGLETVPGEEDRKRRVFDGGMGCDPATFRGSQPVRLPGAHREPNLAKNKVGGTQTIIYLA